MLWSIVFMARSTQRQLTLSRLGALTALAALHATGCTHEAVEPSAASAVETVPLHVLARNIGDYRGQIVRTCGGRPSPVRSPDGEIREWELRVTDPTSEHRFTAFVIVPSCNGQMPRLVDGCVTGRVAREDGSLDPPTSMSVISHFIGSDEWWIHPPCSA